MSQCIFTVPTLDLYYSSLLFFFNHPATTEIYTLSLHDALPSRRSRTDPGCARRRPTGHSGRDRKSTRLNSSRPHLVCRLLLEKKKNAYARSRQKTRMYVLLSTTDMTAIGDR